MRILPILSLACVMLVSHPATAASSTSLVVFGDSLSDTGLVWQRLQTQAGLNLPVSPPYAQGRFSNGPVAVEYMAQSLGATLDNHAWGGATTGEDNVLDQAALAHTGVTAQIAQYLQGRQGQPLDESAVYMLWAGANDLIYTPDEATAVQAGAQLMQGVEALYQAGARRFFLPSIPDLSWLPLLGGPENALPYHAISVRFNQVLEEGLGGMRAAHADAVWASFDTPALIGSLASQSGLDVQAPCVKSFPGVFTKVQAVCSTPEAHMFWDSSHFTTGIHAQLGQAFAASWMAAVPEPASQTQLMWGLGGLVCLLIWQRPMRA